LRRGKGAYKRDEGEDKKDSGGNKERGSLSGKK
jgi:hypothetical protein